MAGELRGYIWYYCCLAIPREATSLRASLAEFLKTGSLFTRREPGNAPKEIAGYSAFAESIWVRPYLWTVKRADDQKPKLEAGKFLYPSQRLREHLQDFAHSETFSDWRLLGRSRELDEQEYPTLSSIMGAGARTRLEYDGVVLVGSGEQRGVTWMGVRHDVRYADLMAAQMNRRLAWPEDIIQPAVDLVKKQSLFARAAGTLSLDSVDLDDLSVDVVTAYAAERDLPENVATQVLAGPIADGTESLRRHLGLLRALPARRRPNCLLVVTTLPFEDA